VKPNEWWGIDMTKFLVESLGWVYVVIVVDWFSRKIVGYSIDRGCRTDVWIAALDKAVIEVFHKGTRAEELHLMSDNGSQPTSGKFINTCQTLEIKQAFTSYNNPKGNANTERMFRTMKEDCIWINDFETYDQALLSIEKWINFYNEQYLPATTQLCCSWNSAINYMSPNEFLQKYYTRKAA